MQSYPIVGVFDDMENAERAVRSLRNLGFAESQIGVTGRDWENNPIDYHATEEGEETYAAEGAAAGVAGGAGIGLLWGLGALSGTMPVIGPAIAAGTLAALLSSAAAGAAAAGLGGLLIGMGIPREEATYYEGEFAEGRYVVTVHANGREDVVRKVFQDNHAYDYSTRHEVHHAV